MLITGYHGTTLAKAQSIIKERLFHISESTTEWLGCGIYFYEKFSDAYSWAFGKNEYGAVLHSVISIEDDEYLDIDSPEGEKVWSQMIEHICKEENIELQGTYQENQCAVCRMIWDSNPELKVLAASFATIKTKIRVLIDKRPKRREFCVRNNDAIKSIQIVDYKEV